MIYKLQDGDKIQLKDFFGFDIELVFEGDDQGGRLRYLQNKRKLDYAISIGKDKWVCIEGFGEEEKSILYAFMGTHDDYGPTSKEKYIMPDLLMFSRDKALVNELAKELNIPPSELAEKILSVKISNKLSGNLED